MTDHYRHLDAIRLATEANAELIRYIAVVTGVPDYAIERHREKQHDAWRAWFAIEETP